MELLGFVLLDLFGIVELNFNVRIMISWNQSTLGLLNNRFSRQNKFYYFRKSSGNHSLDITFCIPSFGSLLTLNFDLRNRPTYDRRSLSDSRVGSTDVPVGQTVPVICLVSLCLFFVIFTRRSHCEEDKLNC